MNYCSYHYEGLNVIALEEIAKAITLIKNNKNNSIKQTLCKYGR